MALTSCPDCKSKVSDLAASCIHCGRPMTPKIFDASKNITNLATSKKNGYAGIIFGFVMLMVLFSMLSQCSSEDSNIPTKSAEQTLIEYREKIAREKKRFEALTPEQQLKEKKDAKNKADNEAKIAAKQAKDAEVQKAKDEVLATAKVKTLLLVQQVKASTRNPASFQLISASFTDAGASCIRYRGQNGFGGYSVENVSMANDKIKSNDPAHWNRHCANKQNYSAE